MGESFSRFVSVVGSSTVNSGEPERANGLYPG